MNTMPSLGQRDFVITGMRDDIAQKLKAFDFLDRAPPEHLVRDIATAKRSVKPIMPPLLVKRTTWVSCCRSARFCRWRSNFQMHIWMPSIKRDRASPCCVHNGRQRRFISRDRLPAIYRARHRTERDRQGPFALPLISDRGVTKEQPRLQGPVSSCSCSRIPRP